MTNLGEKMFKKELTHPEFNVGDTVAVSFKVIEGNKERIQEFKGTVIRKHGKKGASATFTVRKVTAGIGIERIFPIHSPKITAIKKTREGSVRRARLFYLRDKIGKAAKIKEKRWTGK